ncbi:hypothetical protein [Rheinheimera nanhaiensis]|uniref:Uncharacterized protein n=1 Tax=Rheinheimera nanhaiensis E407-8 TaxID=562729 RepID=I1DUB2_9GAMM|nr:hypothetical protein [Rheinheimera nanhaiensis]GAB57640.1 hypothetical protein RNAN_0609 [Rheinheimera nanhaiensis E407-8]
MVTMELSVIVLNAVIVLVAYLSVYPKLAGNSFNKISFYDLFASGLALAIVGSKYWGSGQQFSLVVADVNWFWFTLITYAIIEIPVMLWYFKKNNVDVKIKR